MATFRVSPFAPANETAHDLYVERLIFDGFQLGDFATGACATTVIAALCVHSLLTLRARQPRFAYALLAYVFVIYSLGLIGNSANMKWVELCFIENRDYPGGPIAYFNEQGSFVMPNLLSLGAYIVATWMQDGFLLYRFLVVFDYNWWIAIVPICVFLFSIIMSCIFLAEVNSQGAGFFSTTTVNFALGYWVGSIVTTVVLTSLIVGKLLYIRQGLRKSLGKDFDRRSPYITISAMLIESACLYTIFALPFVVLFARNDPFQNIFLPALGQVQIMAPLLIILRVAQGRSFTQRTIYNSSQAIRSGSTRQPVSVHLQMDVVTSRSTPSTAFDQAGLVESNFKSIDTKVSGSE
ncbi:hypothetical protein K488DRAFT_57979 [Vararia minispora EC-137]|uniref:Uncharacterized protein n=1 Tax=Vararia minispora EC-137 TaxID=1314806 RepID=A0ACB8QBP7_9AGAM|nr:hypothetical protein K488DRAFT_57979 [Vararia minispora EC-137]